MDEWLDHLKKAAITQTASSYIESDDEDLDEVDSEDNGEMSI